MLDTEAVLQRITFHSAPQARQNLSSLFACAPRTVVVSLVALLEASANPDAALNLFERLAREHGEVLRLMERHPYLIHYAIVVFSNSQWLGETLIQNPDLFQSFVREHSLDRLRSREEFRENFARVRSRSFEADISLLLARFKRREYLRIMLRDLLGTATLAETTAEISALSDVLIDEALVYCDALLRNRYGPPQHVDDQGRVEETPFTVLSLGKLGGNELNYSSDIDLLYVYGTGSDAGTSSISNREYFVRLAQDVTDVLSRLTREGAVFRIDLRLRPQGAEGEPAIAVSHALRYYRDTAHDWELQALIKVRHSAGDQALARMFIREVQPHVYRGETNFAAIETALQARTRVSQRRRALGVSRRVESIDVKLDRGGIRDIEFLVQCLQRVYGGTERWLRSSGTLFSLQKLHDKSHISGKDFHELTNTYEFLRKIEHRLQLRNGQQTHRLPHAKEELRVLERSIFGNDPERKREELVSAVRRTMETVAEIYDRIIHQQQQSAEPSDLRLLSLPSESGSDQSYDQLLARLAADSPELYRVATDPQLTGHVRKNLYRFLGASRTSAVRYAAVTQFPGAVERALPIFGVSEFLTELLLRHPEEIAALEQAQQGEGVAPEPLFSTPESGGELQDPVFKYLGTAPADSMALLRRHYRDRVFRSGARDVLNGRRVFESLHETSSAAEAAIAAAHRVAGATETGFTVLALGRLGTREFDVLSDADLLFLCDDGAQAHQCTKWAERIIEVLSAYTSEGTLFPVDARLRPHGGEGELITTPSHLVEYFKNEARPWEVLTYLKLRHVSGDLGLAERAIAAVAEGAGRFREGGTVAGELRAMRKRLEESESGASLNLKTSRGAIYDLDFIAGFLELKAREAASGRNLRERLAKLRRAGVLSHADWLVLDDAAELFRAAEHAVRLVAGRARKSLPVGELALKSAERLVEGFVGRKLQEGLERDLRHGMLQVRQVYSAVLGD